MKIKTGKTDPNHSLTTKDIAAQIIVIHIEAALDHNTGIDAPTTDAAHDNLTQPKEDTARSHCDTLHWSHHRSSTHLSSLGY